MIVRPALVAAALVLGITAARAESASADPETVSFPSNDADLTGGSPTTLRGLVYRPAGEGPFPAVVALPGCDGLFGSEGKVREHYDSWGRLLGDEGYLAFFVDSFGPRGVGRVCGMRESPASPRRERARDAYGGLLYAQSRRDVRADRIGLLGWSHGGSSTLWTIAESFSARPAGLANGDFRAAVAFYPGCQFVGQEASWSTRIPSLVLVGEADNWTPAAPCIPLVERARAAGADVEMVLYPGAYHAFEAPNLPLRVIADVVLPNGISPTAGTNPEARAKAIERALTHFARHLKDDAKR